METRRWLRKERGFRIVVPRNGQIFQVRPAKSRGFFPPRLWRNIEVLRTHQVPDATALVCLGDTRPEAVELLRQRFRFIEDDARFRKQIKHRPIGPSDRRIELPAGKHTGAGVAHGLFDDFG